jgi:nucleoside-diphosphate-sugar epimerase
MESTVLGLTDSEGIVLRYANSYGPGTSLGIGGYFTEAMRKRQVPTTGPGTGIWSFVHVRDAAGTTLAAIERGGTGLHNIADGRACPRENVVAGVRQGRWRQTAPARPDLAGTARHRWVRREGVHAGPRSSQ